MITIEQIKQELHDIIELSDKATPGPWEHGYGNPLVRVKGYCVASTGNAEFVAEDCPIIPCYEQVANSELIAASRNLTPKMAQALLTTIKALEWMNNDDHGGEVCDNDGQGCRACRHAFEQLEKIRKEWEVKP